MTSEFELYTYVQCVYCAHFVVFEPDENQWTHLDNGEQNLATVNGTPYPDGWDEKYDHDASPGQADILRTWRLRQPDLFEAYEDGNIGPNSAHFPRRRGFKA